MDFKEFISYLHDAGDPQYAQIHPSNIIEYCTSVQLAKIGTMLGPGDSKQRLHDIAMGFAAAIVPLSPERAIIKINQLVIPTLNNYKELEGRLKSGAIEDGRADIEGLSRLRIYYQAKTDEEFKEIREFFESVPEDTGMPKKGQEFFCYA